jgi:hypothetical protein
MTGVRTRRLMVLLALFLGTALLIVMAPPAAHAAWTSATAHILDPNGTGYVSVLNVKVANSASNDTSTVTEVQFSDDGSEWYGVPYTATPQDWVLYGEAGLKTLYVRFAAADGTVSPTVETKITVDTEGPWTRAVRAARTGRRGCERFVYVVGDNVSSEVQARLLIRGPGVRKTVSLGWVRPGAHKVRARLDLPRGRYRWSVAAVDLAFWSQWKKGSATFVVK